MISKKSSLGWENIKTYCKMDQIVGEILWFVELVDAGPRWDRNGEKE